MLRQLSISTRCTLGFSLIALVVIIVGFFGLFQMQRIADLTENVRTHDSPTSAALGNMREAVLGVRVNSLKVALYPSPQAREDSSRHLEVQLDKMAQSRAAYEAAVDNDEERELFAAIKPLLDQTASGVRQLIELSQAGRDGEMVELLNGSLRDNSEKAFPLLFKLGDVNRQNMDDSFVEVAEVFSSSRTNILLLIGLAAVLTGLIAWRVSRSMVGPIGSAVGLAEAIAKGDLTRAITPDGRDEVTRLYVALAAMQRNLKATIEQILDSSQVISASSVELTGVTEGSRHTLQRQNDEIEQAAAAVTEMTAAVEEVARTAVLTSQASGECRNAGESGQARVSETLQAIERMGADIEQSADGVGGLASQVRDIAKVLDVIRGIAEQTNLLALNAAIEAARAGEAGRGFAVVADEVRALAHRTQQSTLEIEEMVQSIREGSDHAVGAMNLTRERSAATLAVAQQAQQALQAIITHIANINEQNLIIASAAEEQAQVAREVDRNLINIRDLSAVSTTQADQTAAASQALQSLGATLSGRVATFTV
ncbi:methyl-accepting chemotaxis protein [Pseudomonas sp. URIL14HWK12:I9]|uniref:methyl-accepting chemotaxis protein n=1 Tax=unclassified Pseudomonas TaxID=196821 RepID=UPI000BC68BC4|nr:MULTISPECIES: methyl-accepting chemotaxis protein [unclassified Pseudomonas]PVZ20532.1 methyl-accepting chemotaxis protein [Pseudomonas sp. URIL14HWK12:I12]PVZ27598.1 methyl-accepting chemotaxis protein [Pseudomonas sp. URIL14HWK12:I10]PVZ38487.1 methyl-accepting chemotaxis protein [Pseudomonas sp. URIL14HWK12:I11]SNZ03161.1 methyl-accepting chemotaxis protein [Pseudomonas sp. URIL14HWK12:I9]